MTMPESPAVPRGRQMRLLVTPAFWDVVAALGVVATVAGLAIDAWRHEAAPAEETLLSFSNPGHPIAGAGLVLTGISVLLALTVSRLGTLSIPRDTAIRFGTVGAVWVVVIGTSASALTYISASGATVGHSHEPQVVHADAAHADVAHEALGEHTLKHDHGAHPTYAEMMALPDAELMPNFPEDTITPDDLPLLRAQLQKVREVASKYVSFETALASGYAQATTDVDQMGIHLLNIEYVTDGVFDPARPEGLLYSRIDGLEPTLVGVWFLQVPGVGNVVHDVEPDGFAGKLDYWHGHQNVCLPFETEGESEAGCVAKGGRFVVDSRWMMHVWVLEGPGENPDGVFAYFNRALYERQVASNGGDPDSDGDGMRDSRELELGFDPIHADANGLGELQRSVSNLPEAAFVTALAAERSAALSALDRAASLLAAGDIEASQAALSDARSRIAECTVHSEGAPWMEACARQTAVREAIDHFMLDLGRG